MLETARGYRDWWSVTELNRDPYRWLLPGRHSYLTKPRLLTAHLLPSTLQPEATSLLPSRSPSSSYPCVEAYQLVSTCMCLLTLLLLHSSCDSSHQKLVGLLSHSTALSTVHSLKRDCSYQNLRGGESVNLKLLLHFPSPLEQKLKFSK